ncbi:TonB-dependent receptor [Pacificimonas flava]|uniref:TonB-dependent receptor n=1 Tax=Pacificimonas flava TaxID=1234595 RepID=M2SDM8_9SPHN|nr:TonB-dependent receptor [Pacificimonas flava]EMD83470.1 TonB-dependent receptor [Pacificimonas flava]MBB5278973.1 TonB-dependent receptor [Pacificimonas flava]
MFRQRCHSRSRLSASTFAIAAAFALVPGAFGSLPANAQTASAPAEVRGRVGTPSGVYFEGAEVTLPELGRRAVTTTGGRFSFPGVPAGTYTLRTLYLGATPVEQQIEVGADGKPVDVRVVLDDPAGQSASPQEILVVGQTASASSAANRKRNSDRVSDSVSADFIGQFPDQNVTEAAQRIPGVAINRDQGEGRFISIRGADPNLNAVTINGVDVPSAESDARSVALDVIPSDVLQTLTVVKSLTPDLDANSIGGTVQIGTASAFDRNGPYLSASAEGHYNDLRDLVSPRLSLSASNVFEVGGGDLGIYGSISYFNRRLGSDGVENGEGVDSVGGTAFPVAIEPRDYVLTRERLGATLNIDYHVNPDFTLYVRQLYSRFSDDEVQGGTIFEADPDDGANVAQQTDTTLLLADQELESYVSEREEVQTIYSLSAGGENQIGRTLIEYSANYSEAGEDNPDYVEPLFVADFSDTDTLIGTDLSDPRRPEILFSGDGFRDASLYELDEIIFESSETMDKRYGGKIDVTHEMDIGAFSGYLKTGAKLALRDKSSDLDARIYGGADQGLTIADFLNGDIDYPLGPIAPQAFPRDVANAVEADQALFDEDFDEEGSFIDSNAEDFRIDEDIYAGYLMGAADIGALRIVGGVRVEHTEYRAEGNEVSLDEETGSLSLSPINVDRSYTDVLPSLNTRYAFSDKLQARAAYYRSVVRPNFEQSRPASLIERDSDGVIEAAAGNTALDPYRADNFDLTLEYYPGSASVLSAGAFYKNLANPIFPIDFAGTEGFEGFDEYASFVNGNDAQILGLEFAVQQQLNFLPAPLDGFLVAANYTFVDSDAELPLPGGGVRDAPMPFQARHTANASLGYDRDGFQFRVSMSYRDRILDEIGSPTDPEGDVYIDDHIQVDLTASYRLARGIRVFGSVTNINDRPLYSYQGRSDVNVQYEEYGPSANLGVRVTFGAID